MKDRDRLCTFEFAALNLVLFFAFCNIAVFYGFFTYLGRIGIAPEWRGFLIGLEPMTAFLLRLVLIPFITVQNSVRVMLVSLILLIPVLFSYTFFATLPLLIPVRIFHGFAFVLLVSSAMALVVYFIPKSKVGQGFGIVSVSTLAPYVIMPQVTEILLRRSFVETQIYAGVSPFAAIGILLIIFLDRRVRRELSGEHATLTRRLSWDELRDNLRSLEIKALLGLTLILYVIYATVFYFLKDFAHQVDRVDAGSFFTIAMLTVILVRLLGSTLFDRVDKNKALRATLCLLSATLFFLGFFRLPLIFYMMAAFYGVAIGIVFPLLNARIYLASSLRLRGVNANLSIFLMDAGFTVSPFLGGLFLALGGPVYQLLYFCSVLALSGLVFLSLSRMQKEPQKDLKDKLCPRLENP